MSTPAVAAQNPSSTALFEAFFATKTACDVAGTMAYFSRDLVAYIDATLGWVFDGHDALRTVFEQYMPGWGPPARSYTTGVHGDTTSAVVRMVDTPELFGGELRVLAAIDRVDGVIVRWVDYWDSSSFDDALYEQFRTPAAAFPNDLRDADVPTQAAAEVVAVATALQEAFGAADAVGAAELLHTDVVLEDMALRCQVIGRIEVGRYLGRVLERVPYGRSSRLRHVVGDRRGGGFEWTAGLDARGLVGITALELDDDGLVTRISSVYDSRQLDPALKVELVTASMAP
jgi:hypothetical protein